MSSLSYRNHIELLLKQCHVITRILLIRITKIVNDDRKFLNMRSFLSCIMPSTFFQDQTLGYFKILYLKNISEVNLVAFPESCTGPVLLSIGSTQSSRSQCHCSFVKLGWDLVGAFLLLLTEILYYIYVLFFFPSSGVYFIFVCVFFFF